MLFLRGLFKLLVFLAIGVTALVVLAACWLLIPTLPEPDFQSRKGTLLEARLTGTWQVEGGRIEELRLRSNTGLEVALSLRIPEIPLPERPLLIMISGQETGRKAVELLPDPRGVTVAALGYPFGTIPHRDLVALAFALPEIQRGILDIPATVMLATDYLANRPDLDPGRIELAGISFGAYIAAVPAVLDPRIARLWLIHGSGDPEGVIYSVMRKRIGNDAARRAAAWFLATGAFSHHISPEQWVGLVAPRPLIVVSAADDSTLPLSAVRALHNALQPPSEVLWSPGDHVHPKRPGTINYITGMLFERISGGGEQE